MTFETWAAFAAASAILLVIPGPTVLLVVSYALGQGWRAALPLAIGVTLGDFTAMTFSLLGVGALLLASATLFTALKWLGAAYLIYMGVKLFRAGGRLEAAPSRADVPAFRLFSHAFLVTSLNPKTLTFFVAFLPQFLDRSGDLLPQMVILEATFLTLAALNVGAYALLASGARRTLGDVVLLRWLNRIGGSLLVGAGVASLASRTSP